MYSESEKRISVPESYLLRLQSQARTAGTRVHDGMPSPAETTATEVEWAFPGTDNWVLCQPGQYRECGHSLEVAGCVYGSQQYVADYMGNSSSTYIANRLNPTTETLAWHNYPHCKQPTKCRATPFSHVVPR